MNNLWMVCIHSTQMVTKTNLICSDIALIFYDKDSELNIGTWVTYIQQLAESTKRLCALYFIQMFNTKSCFHYTKHLILMIYYA